LGVVTFNRLDLLKKCWPSWRAAQLPIFCWDNGSSSETVLWLKAHEMVLHQNPNNSGVWFARNRLIDRIKALGFKYALLIDSDIELYPGTVEAMVDIAERCANVIFVGWPQANHGFVPTAEGYVEELAHECILNRLNAWEDVGRFPESLLYYSGDSWISTLANMVGWKTALVLGRGDGYFHHKHGSQGNPGTKEAAARDVERWQKIERKMIDYWSHRLQHGKGGERALR
jgi:glycosyltransferase involved in cell wall biosynthesis